VIPDEGTDQELRQPSSESLLEPRVGARTGGVPGVERGAVLEEEQRPTPARSSVRCGCGHALSIDAGWRAAHP
jgi:hypothetical protein